MSLLLPRLAIGPLEIDFPVVQAALSGYSDAAMRTIARRLGAPYTVAEVVLDEFLLKVRQARVRRQWMSVSPEQHPVGGQLMGADPARFAPAARRLVDAGFDVIDINFGCPVRKVLGRCRGGFHLGQPKIALEIVAHVRDAVPHAIPITVKMRRGLDDGEASREKFFTILDGAFARGVAAVTVHGRTVAQRYDGPSEWDFLRRVKQHVGSRTVLGSGDLFTAQDCLDMLRYTGVDGCTVARGAIGNPWIFSQVRALASGNPLPTAPSLWQQREVIAAHYTLAEQLYGADRCLPPMRKFGIKYAQLHPDAVAVRDAFVRVRQAGEWRDVLRTWYAEDRPGRAPVPDEVNPRSSSAVAN